MFSRRRKSFQCSIVTSIPSYWILTLCHTMFKGKPYGEGRGTWVLGWPHITQNKLYGVRNLEMTIRFSLKSRPSERFHRPEMYQIKAEISLRINMKLIFHKNVGLKWYKWIPDFYNIRFEQNNLMEKNYVGSNLML